MVRILIGDSFQDGSLSEKGALFFLYFIRLETLKRARRYVLVLMFLVAGILTPGPDVLSQFLLAVPLLLLYELSVLAVWVIQKRK